MHTHFHFLNTASLGYSFTMCFPFFVGTMQIFLVLWLYFCITYSIMYHFQNQAFVLQWSLNFLSLKLSFIHRFGILRSLLISSRVPFWPLNFRIVRATHENMNFHRNIGKQFLAVRNKTWSKTITILN